MSYNEWDCCTEGYIENMQAKSGFVAPLTREELEAMENEWLTKGA